MTELELAANAINTAIMNNSDTVVVGMVAAFFAISIGLLFGLYRQARRM